MRYTNRYEYKILKNQTEWLLNKLGLEGWDLVGLVTNEDKNQYFYLKRIKEPEEPTRTVLDYDKAKRAVNIPIEEYVPYDRNRSIRVINSLNNIGIHTLGDLFRTPLVQMHRIRNCGHKSISYLNQLLQKDGFEIGMLYDPKQEAKKEVKLDESDNWVENSLTSGY